MTGLFGIVVALITIVGGGLVYIWQKAEDRRERYRSEKQQIFKDYLRSMRRVVSCAISAAVQKNDETLNALSEAEREHDDILDLFELYSDEPLRKLSLNLERALLEWRDGLLKGQDETTIKTYRDTYLKSRIEIVKNMRADLFGGVEQPPVTAFGNWLRSKLSTGRTPE